MSPFKVSATKVGEEVAIPPEIDVLEENGKTVHVLHLQISVDVNEIKDSQEILDATHLKMAETIKLEAMALEEKWKNRGVVVG